MKTFKGTIFTILAVMLVIVVTHTEIQSQDFRVRGRLHMDAFYGLNDADEFSNGFNNRRARLGATGKLNANWDGLIEVDFADAGVVANDFRIRRSYPGGSKIAFGQFKVPQGLNQLTSSNSITFIERSSVSNIVPDARRIGVGYYLYKENFGFESMVFGRAVGTRSAIKSDMPIGGALRGLYYPKFDIGQFHLGASVVHEELYSNHIVRYSDRPEARDSKGGSIRYINTGNIDGVKSTFKMGMELLYLNGPLLVEAELLQVTLNMKDGGNNSFIGYHVQSSYMITGGTRTYKDGVTGGLSPEGDKGAWEVALRYSVMDLDGIYLGGEQSNITLGVNRYVTTRLRFMANVIVVNTDQVEGTPILGVVRAQFNF